MAVIYCVDGQIKRPIPGLYAIRLRRRLRERALGIKLGKDDKKWVVFLDGEQMAPPSAEWTKAFGWIFERCQPLWGTPITIADYKALIAKRQLDKARGVDLAQPIDLNKEGVAL